MLRRIYFITLCLTLVSVSCAPRSPVVPPKSEPVATSAALVEQSVSSTPPLGAISSDIPSIKVALLVPLSGESAAVGNAMFDAATLALYDAYVATPSEQIKAKLVIIPKDTGSTASETLTAVTQAVEQGVSFVIGPLFGQSVTAIKPFLKEHKVTMLSFSNNKAVASPEAFTFGYLPEQQVDRIADYAYLSKFGRVAVLAPNDAYGEKVRDRLGEIYARKGGIAAPAELYAPSQANIDAAVARIAGAYNNTPEDRRFQALFIADGGNQMKNIIKSIHKNNLNLEKLKIFGAGITDDESFAGIPELHGALFPCSPPEPFDKFVKRFTAAYGYKPVRLAALTYDAVNVVAVAAMSGKGIVNEALTDPKGFNTPAGGLVRLLPSGASDRKLCITEITKEGFKLVDKAPKEFSDAK